MSKEKKFHQLIEELNQEEKERCWKKIQEQDTSCIVPVQQTSVDVVKRKGVATWKKALVTSFVSIVVVGAGVFGGIKLFSKDEAPATRYCDTSMYTMQDVTVTLKERTLQEEIDILFLDWYEITDFYMDQVYWLNDSQLEIGYYEQIADVNTGSLVEINAIQKAYQLESVDIYSQMTGIFTIQSVQVDWRDVGDMQYATFSYQEYNYYISLEYPMEEDSILDIIEEMLLSA